MYKELNMEKIWLKLCVLELNWCFSKRDVQVANRYMKNVS